MFISNYLSLSRNTVKKYISLFEVLALPFESINQKTYAELEALFSHNTVETISPKLQTLYDFFPQMEWELKKVGFSVRHIWEQYIAPNPDGFQSSQFRHHYKIWGKKVNPVMNMNHKDDDKMYVENYTKINLNEVEKNFLLEVEKNYNPEFSEKIQFKLKKLIRKHLNLNEKFYLLNLNTESDIEKISEHHIFSFFMRFIAISEENDFVKILEFGAD